MTTEVNQEAVKELQILAHKISSALTEDKIIPCPTLRASRILCMAKAEEFRQPNGTTIAFVDYEKFVYLCTGCKSYWLALRLEKILTDLY